MLHRELVNKTVNWTIEKLRDEVLSLNRLIYPYRYEPNRTALLQVGSYRMN